MMSTDSFPPQPRKLAVFVSSTFLDTVEERNAFMSHVYPNVRDYAKSLDLEFEAVEMRWGIRYEASSDHRTVEMCMQQLERCRKESAGLFFVSLWGDRYGWRPLPSSLLVSDAELFLPRLSADNRASFYEVYERDDNAVPPAFRLASCGPGFEYRWKLHPALRQKLIQATEGVWPQDKRHKILVRGVTELETEQALHSLLPSSDRRVLWMRRRFRSLPASDEKYGVYVDLDNEGCVDDEARTLWENYVGEEGVFKSKAKELGSTVEIMDFECDYEEGVGVTSSSPHVATMVQKFSSLLRDELDSIYRRRLSWIDSVRQAGLSSVALSEFRHHHRWGEEKVKSFFGRESLVETLVNHVLNPCVLDAGLQVAVVGGSGCGKTALMAKAAQVVRTRLGDGAVVFERYLGTSSLSGTAHEALATIAQEWYFLNGDAPSATMAAAARASTKEAVEAFHESMRQASLSPQTVVLFLDSLDQMRNIEESRTKFRWLEPSKGTKNGLLSPNIRVVVSCLPDDDTWTYGCETRVIQLGTPVVRVGGLTPADVEETVKGVLGAQGRRVTEKQLSALCSPGEKPSALLCRLNLRKALRWSHTHDPSDVCKCVRDAIFEEFERLERLYGDAASAPGGDQFVWRAMAYLTVSRLGLSAQELEDVLSLDDSALHHVFQYWVAPIRRVPQAVIRMLLMELSGLLVERERGLLGWYHRQLLEAAEARYVSGNDGRDHHEPVTSLRYLLSEYFRGEWHEKMKTICKPSWSSSSLPEEPADRMVPTQELVLRGTLDNDDCVLNRRRGEEGAWQLLLSRHAPDASNELCDVQYAECRFSLGQGYNYIRELQQASVLLPGDKRVREFLSFVRNNVNLLSSDPSCTASEAWNDCFGSAPCEQASGMFTKFFEDEASQHDLADTHERRRVWSRKLPRLTSRGAQTTSIDVESWISSLVYSSDGDVVIGGGHDGVIREWEVDSAECVRTFEGHTESITCISLRKGSSSFVVMASSSRDKTVRLWSMKDAAALATFSDHDSEVSSVCFNVTGMLVASSDRRGKIIIRTLSADFPGSLALGGTMTLSGHESEVPCIDFHPSRNILASCSWDKTIRIWCAIEGTCVATLRGHTDWVHSVRFIPGDEEKLVSGSRDKTVRIWTVPSKYRPIESEAKETFLWWKMICVQSGLEEEDGIQDSGGTATRRTFKKMTSKALTGHTDEVTTVISSPDGNYVVSGSRDMKVQIWNTCTMEPVKVLEGHSSVVLTGAYDPKGVMLATSSADDTLRIWDTTTSVQGDLKDAGHTHWVTCVAWHPTRSDVLASGSYDNTLRVWDTTCFEVSAVFKGHGGWIFDTSFSPSGKFVATASDDKTVRVWEWEKHRGNSERDETSHVTLDGHAAAVKCVCFVQEFKVAAGSKDGIVRIWDTRTKTVDVTLKGHGDEVTSVSLSPNGETLSTTSFDKSIRLWDWQSGRCFATLVGHVHRTTWSTFHPTRKEILVSAAKDKTLRVWMCVPSKDPTTSEAVDAEVLHVLSGHTWNVTCASFSPDGRILASSSWDRTVRLWDWEKGECVRVLRGHEDWVMQCKFSPTEYRLATAGKDTFLRIWS
eukprot:Rmarinus@m.3959